MLDQTEFLSRQVDLSNKGYKREAQLKERGGKEKERKGLCETSISSGVFR